MNASGAIVPNSVPFDSVDEKEKKNRKICHTKNTKTESFSRPISCLQCV